MCGVRIRQLLWAVSGVMCLLLDNAAMVVQKAH